MAVTVVCCRRCGGCWCAVRFCSSWGLSSRKVLSVVQNLGSVEGKGKW